MGTWQEVQVQGKQNVLRKSIKERKKRAGKEQRKDKTRKEKKPLKIFWLISGVCIIHYSTSGIQNTGKKINKSVLQKQLPQCRIFHLCTAAVNSNPEDLHKTQTTTQTWCM